MITKIDKPLDKLKIGVMGTRAYFIQKSLEEFNIPYHYIEDSNPNWGFYDDYDLILGSGIYTILPDNIISSPKYGCYFIHESPLPEGRGHAPIQWAIKNNRPNLTLTLFKVLPGVDDGHIVYQHNKQIDNFDCIKTIEETRAKGITECISIFLEELKEGVIVSRKQTGQGSYHKKRNPKDSELTTITNKKDFWDELRMCDNDRYPAFFKYKDKKIILKYSIDDSK